LAPFRRDDHRPYPTSQLFATEPVQKWLLGKEPPQKLTITVGEAEE
jgi:hypothetical protein